MEERCRKSSWEKRVVDYSTRKGESEESKKMVVRKLKILNKMGKN
jgi:hypothetical protein